jgi:hypothetical protein
MRRRPAYAALALFLVGAALLRGLIATAAASHDAQTQVARSALPGLLAGPAPWGPNVRALRARLADVGLPALAQEGSVLHIHQHVDLLVDGRRVTVPAGIGIDPRGRYIAPIHTHDASGVIHVESPTVRRLTLGDLFDVWGLRLTARCLGGYCAGGGKTLRTYVGGRLQRGDPRRIPLTSHAEIAIVFGGRTARVPSTYRFPPGL